MSGPRDDARERAWSADAGGAEESTLIDLLWRLVYRLAFLTLRAWWWCARPHATGAHVAVWSGNRLLIIRNSYRDQLSVPGGGVGRGEDPLDAACRELKEEVGIDVTADRLVPFGRIDVDHDHLHDHCHFFELILDAAPTLRVDGRELIWAGFVPAGALLSERLHAPTREYLRERRARARMAGRPAEP